MQHNHIFKTLLVGLLLLACGGQGVWAAGTFSVTNSGATFTITRSGNTTVAETVYYRTVSLSAIEGQHFTAASGTLNFAANETSKTVTITESTPGTDAYKYQTATSRTYRFEVLDRDGYILASKDRTMTTGTQFTDTYLNQSITGLTYFDRGGDGSILSGTTHYLDVAHSGSAGTWVKVSDSGYKQAVHTISTAALYGNNSALRTYLNSIGMKMYATVYFTQKEEDDGYQYIQILADNASTYDGDDPNGAVSTPSTSLYKACFILSYSPSGSVMSDPHTQFFPHRWDYADRAAQYSGNSWNWQEFDYDNAHLYEQEFKSATYRAENSGSLVLDPTVSNLNIRFDAAGSGGDDWYLKDLKVRLALVDATAPTVLNNYKVSGGRHQKGNVIYVSVAFSEIVTVTGTPTLTTSWGTLSYTAGSGTNVLTFKGEISSDATGTFSVSALSGTVSDLAGNAFSGTVSHSFGTALDDDYAWTTADFVSLGTNTYAIATKTDLRHLALLVNVAKNACTGLTFRQTQDITCDNTYTPIGYHASNSDEALFRGTYDGQDFTVSGITVSRTGTGDADSYMGLFGYVDYESATDYGTVRNVVLANSTFTGKNNVGGIVGYMSGGIVENCRVESTVTINAGNDNAKYHGGIVGTNRRAYAKIIGCYSAAVVSNNGKSYSRDFGGIVGYNSSGTVKDCLYAGTTVTADEKKGAIIGYDEYNNGVFTNNYYTAISLGGVNGSDKDGARRARTVSLDDGIAIAGTQTAYNVSGLTAIGTTALRSGETIYSGATQTLTLAYSGSVPEGFIVTYSATAGTLSGSTLTMPADDVTVSAAIQMPAIAAAQWHTLSAFTHDNSQTYLSPANVDDLDADAYDLYRYDEASGTWQNVKSSSFNLEPARGYIYRCNDSRALTHKGDPNNAASYSIALTATPSAGGPADLQGFNLVGNPYPFRVLLDRAFYSLNTDGSWTAHPYGDSLDVGQGALVHAATAETLIFYRDTRSTNAGASARSLPPLPKGLCLGMSSEVGGVSSEVQGRFAAVDGDNIVVTGTGTLTAYDLMGRELFRREMKNEELRMKNSAFPGTGVYLLRLGAQTQKIVIR